MSVILLVPGIISLLLILQRRINKAFLSVYLPCLLLLPVEYSFRIPHLPPLSAAQFALIPLGIVGLSRLIRDHSFALMDILVFLFVTSISMSEILHEPIRNDGILAAIGFVISMGMSYVVGRKIIEPRLRLTTVCRLVILVLVNVIPGIYEWRMGQSPYAQFGRKFLGASFQYGGGVQLRNGHGRLAGAFDDAEIGGIIFAMAFCLNGWLVYLRKVRPPIDIGKTFKKLQKFHLGEIVLLSCVWLTQSRGPLIALAAGYLILQIPRFRNAKRMTLVISGLLVLGYCAAFVYFRSYTNVAGRYAVTDEQQGSAIYRREMNEVYAPIAEAGGWTGWSVRGIPHVQGKKSIDNEYLLVHLAWGRCGYILFLLITWESVRVAVSRAWRFKAPPDRAFAFSMLSALAVLWITLLTVFMGEQLPELSFLLIGWVQSMAPGKIAEYSAMKTTTAWNAKPLMRLT